MDSQWFTLPNGRDEYLWNLTDFVSLNVFLSSAFSSTNADSHNNNQE